MVLYMAGYVITKFLFSFNEIGWCFFIMSLLGLELGLLLNITFCAKAKELKLLAVAGRRDVRGQLKCLGKLVLELRKACWDQGGMRCWGNGRARLIFEAATESDTLNMREWVGRSHDRKDGMCGLGSVKDPIWKMGAEGLRFQFSHSLL